MVRKILMSALPSCREASALQSQGQDRPLTLRERIRLRAHLALCRGCRNFGRQLFFIRAAMKRYLDRED
jgi:hypothetical protein